MDQHSSRPRMLVELIKGIRMLGHGGGGRKEDHEIG